MYMHMSCVCNVQVLHTSRAACDVCAEPSSVGRSTSSGPVWSAMVLLWTNEPAAACDGTAVECHLLAYQHICSKCALRGRTSFLQILTIVICKLYAIFPFYTAFAYTYICTYTCDMYLTWMWLQVVESRM